MPARIILVHDDPELLAAASFALRQAAHDVMALSDPMVALDLVRPTGSVDVLITQIDFGAGKLHGIALARMVRLRQRSIQVLFVGNRRYAEHTNDEGTFIAHPATVPDVVAAVGDLRTVRLK